MDNSPNNLNQLYARLESLMEKQADLQQELLLLKAAIQSLKNSEGGDSSIECKDTLPQDESYVNPDHKEIEIQDIHDAVEPFPGINRRVPYDDGISDRTVPKKAHKENVNDRFADESFPKSSEKKAYPGKSDIEKFIGENLINKIGIAITVIGVGIGAKYSIENELISPLTRIVFGYMLGLGFIGFAFWLKAEYENFSAVLLSGGMATLYLITFAAYSFYGLFPQAVAFFLMVLFTAFTVLAAIQYNRQVIALIGLVGAYAVPFLLSDGSGKVAVLFTYMAIINSGILVIAVRKYWKPLYYAAFCFTWIIFMSWYFSMYELQEHFILSLFFLCIFFVLFYITFLVYKAIQKEQFLEGDVVLLVLNSFIFYGIGYSILSGHQVGEELLGLFTVFNAIVHFGVSAMVYQYKLADKNLFYLLAGLVLVFVTIAIPVQLDGNWVTLLWCGLAVVLFWIGRQNKVPFYEVLSFPLIILALVSILHDWAYLDASADQLKVLFNFQFLSALFFILAFTLLLFVQNKHPYKSELKVRETLLPFFNIIIPAILLIISYYTFRIEVERFWDQKYLASAVEGFIDPNFNRELTYYDYSLNSQKSIWIINYSMFFLIALTWANILKFKNKRLTVVIYALNVLAIIAFLTSGLYMFSELRDHYLDQTLAEYYYRDSAHLPLRYLSFLFFGCLLYSFYRSVHQQDTRVQQRLFFDYILHISAIWILSSELINWLEIVGHAQSYKLGLSILWGGYALFLIVLGIWKKKKHLRMAAIGLFTVTLLKLFFYDISHLDTIAKTIVFVSLGILLLLISFLYNKYKMAISDEM